MVIGKSDRLWAEPLCIVCYALDPMVHNSTTHLRSLILPKSIYTPAHEIFLEF